jgi:hypothetical protein
MTLLGFLAKMRSCLADNCQLMDHGASKKAISFKRLKILLLSELSNSVGDGEDIFQIKPLTPHR